MEDIHCYLVHIAVHCFDAQHYAVVEGVVDMHCDYDCNPMAVVVEVLVVDAEDMNHTVTAVDTLHGDECCGNTYSVNMVPVEVVVPDHVVVAHHDIHCNLEHFHVAVECQVHVVAVEVVVLPTVYWK